MMASWERGRPARTKPGTASVISPTWINREQRHGSTSAWPLLFPPTGWLPAALHGSSAAAKGTGCGRDARAPRRRRPGGVEEKAMVELKGGENSGPGACSPDHQHTILFILSIDVNQGSTHARRRDPTPGIVGCGPVSFLDNPHKLSIPLQPPFFQSVEPVFRHPNPGFVSENSQFARAASPGRCRTTGRRFASPPRSASHLSEGRVGRTIRPLPEPGSRPRRERAIEST